ncbi:MAG TPA: serine hydrolase domain-containing protein [Thermoanaerobaculia bacterium]|nr:serine hydrolase domain-containing protein [Thermoanaerobaculia bacterium]
MKTRRSQSAIVAVIAVLVVLLVAAPLSANGLKAARPEEVGLSSERLARIGKRMQAYVDSGEIPGALALIARHGKIAYAEQWGFADREKQVRMNPDTLFRIYSMTKPITSVGVMILHEEGRFQLTDPIAQYLPELAELEVRGEQANPATGEVVVTTHAARNPATIRDLLRHTAGFTYGFFGNTEVDQMYRQQGILWDDKDIAETVRKLGQVPLRYEPGTRWHYSVAVDVQGRLIEVVSGQPLDQFLKERIFEPLGMKDTFFAVPDGKWDRLATLYSPEGTGEGSDLFLTSPGGGAKKPLVPADSERANRGYRGGVSHFSGGGGLVSSAMDYLRFAQMMLDGGELDGRRILSRKSVELMTTDHLGDIPGLWSPGYGFGLGFAVLTDLGATGALGSVGEYNWGGAAGTRFWVDPKESLIGIYMIQILPHTGLGYGTEFRSFTYQAIAD